MSTSLHSMVVVYKSRWNLQAMTYSQTTPVHTDS